MVFFKLPSCRVDLVQGYGKLTGNYPEPSGYLKGATSRGSRGFLAQTILAISQQLTASFRNGVQEVFQSIQPIFDSIVGFDFI